MCSRFQVAVADDDDDNKEGKQLTHILRAQENADACNAKASKQGMHLRLESLSVSRSEKPNWSKLKN